MIQSRRINGAAAAAAATGVVVVLLGCLLESLKCSLRDLPGEQHPLLGVS